MKIVSLILCLLLLTILVSAEGQKETISIQKLTLLGSTAQVYKDSLADFEQANPGITVKIITEKALGGATISLDALLARGTPPSIYMGYIGRTGKIITPDYALPLDGVSTIGLYNSAILDTLKRDGKLYAIPMQGWGVPFEINTDVTDSLGMDVPEDFTIADFGSIGAKVKANTDKYPSYVFAGNPSGDYVASSWFAAFGAEMFGGGNYEVTTIDSAAGLATMSFFKQLHARGWIPKESGQLIDDDYIAAWINQDFVMGGQHLSWEGAYAAQVKSGTVEKRNGFTLRAYPRATDKPTPIYFGYSSIVAHNSRDEEKDAATLLLVEHLSNGKVQQAVLRTGGLSSIPALETADDYKTKTAQALIDSNGIWDAGLTQQKFSKIRPQLPSRLQALFAGEEDPSTALGRYAEAINKILQE